MKRLQENLYRRRSVGCVLPELLPVSEDSGGTSDEELDAKDDERRDELPDVQHLYRTKSALSWPPPLLDTSRSHSRAETISHANGGDLAVRVITWNLQGRCPDPSGREFERLRSHLSRGRRRRGLLMVCAQEFGRSILRSLLLPGGDSGRKWEEMVRRAAGEEYVAVTRCAMVGLYIIVLIHRSMLHMVSKVKLASVGTGFNNSLGNKGGAAIFFYLGKSSFCFVNVHLSSKQEKVQRRTADFEKISRKLLTEWRRWTKNQDKIESCNSLLKAFEYIFWAGDMNYRINGDRNSVETLIANNEHAVLNHNDQLTIVRKTQTVFDGILEGPLNFKPTFKLDCNSDRYDTSKKRRIPSWTDRILYKDNSNVQLVAYDSIVDLRFSDHRPVYATFNAKITLDD